MSTSLSIEARLARIEEHLGIEPAAEPPMIPPAMVSPTRDRYQVIDLAQNLRQEIERVEAQLVEAEEEVTLWESGQHPLYPDGPASQYRPGLLLLPDQHRANLASLRDRLAKTTGTARPLTR